MLSRDSHNQRGRHAGMRLLLSFVILLSCVGTCACKKANNEFPTIPTAPTTESTETSESENTTVISTMELTIASPLSYDTCQYLAKLYIAKSQGLLGDGVTGDTVDLSYLDSIDLPRRGVIRLR